LFIQYFRAAFLTGRLPIRYGVAADDTRIRVTIWNSVPAGLPKEELSFANVLRDEVLYNAVIVRLLTDNV